MNIEKTTPVESLKCGSANATQFLGNTNLGKNCYKCLACGKEGPEVPFFPHPTRAKAGSGK